MEVSGSRLDRGRTPLRTAAIASAVWLAVVAVAVAGSASPVLAADPVTFGEGTATSKFGEFVDVKQPVTLAAAPDRIEVLVATPGSVGPSVIPLSESATSGSTTLDYRIDLGDGHIVPNTTFTIQFRVIDTGGRSWLGPVIRHTYADDRFDWKELEGKVVRVHWTEGGQAFGQRALRIGDDAVAATADLLGVTESEPIDFFIYADQQAFYDALGPATRENVGGQAHPDIRTLFALITPADIDASWVESVVPHELTHVVFQTAVDNPYHEPPHWLNEGLAVYLSDSYQDSDRSQVALAAKDGSIIPLDGLAGAFPTTRDRFFLAYAESVSAVDRIVRVSGRDALVKLIRSYTAGVSDDEAFKTALGVDVASFQADWLKELGAVSPTRRGPRPAPAGPLPDGWAAPQPDPSFEVVGSQPPTAPGAPVPSRPGEDPVASLLRSSVAAIGAVLIVVLMVLAIRRARGRPPVAVDAPGDNRLFGRGPGDLDGSEGQGEGSGASSSLWTRSDWSLPRADDPDPGAPQPGALDEPPVEPAPPAPPGDDPDRPPADRDR